MMLGVNHAWRAIPASNSSVFKTRAAEWSAVLLTFVAVTLAWIPFRVNSLSNAGTMLSYLASPYLIASFWGSIESQFGELKYALSLGDEWFKPRELWPAVLPSNYLATETRPLGLVLLGIAVWTFLMPKRTAHFAIIALAKLLTGFRSSLKGSLKTCLVNIYTPALS